jgi:hypothetical protein
MTTRQPPLVKHADHQVEIRAGKGKHFGQYYCIDCDKWVAWISGPEYYQAKSLGLVKPNRMPTLDELGI